MATKNKRIIALLHEADALIQKAMRLNDGEIPLFSDDIVSMCDHLDDALSRAVKFKKRVDKK
jgi:hypothetical protein